MEISSLIIILKILLWVSLGILFYSYIGYGVLLAGIVRIKRLFRGRKYNYYNEEDLPTVSLVIAAFNEEDYIEEKIKNSLELSYPVGKLKIVIITDGSSDSTPEIVSRYPQILLLHQPERKGKVAAMNRAAAFLEGEVLVFCDANTALNKDCIKNIARHYADPRVGGVAGEKKVVKQGQESVAGAGEGLYWKYESLLKRLDSELHSTMGAAGELFSVRRTLFETAPEGTIIEDFVQSLKLCTGGHILRYEPQAYASEGPSASIKEELKRKVRIAAGAFQAMGLLKELFNPFRYPILSFQFVSHRILRWTIAPLSLLIALITNILITFFAPETHYNIILILQLLFFTAALLGWFFASKGKIYKLLQVPYYFLIMNYAVYAGFFRFLKGKQSVLWDKAARQR